MTFTKAFRTKAYEPHSKSLFHACKSSRAQHEFYTAEHRLFHSDIEYSVSQPADSEAVFSNLQELYIMLLNWFFPEKV